MSHFSVLVPARDGEHLKALLQPFHEFECTGENDQYIQEVDVTAEVLEHGLDWYGLEDRTVASMKEIDRDGEHKYGYAIVDQDGKVVKAIDRTNPNAKWDWWQVGGRWSLLAEKFLTRQWETIRQENAERAQQEYEAFHAAWDSVANLEIYLSDDEIKRWNENEYLQKAFPDPEDMARWHKAPKGDDFYHLDLDEIRKLRFMSCDDFKQMHYDRALTYAFIDTDGKWHGRGDMGWWGVDSNRDDGYDKKFFEMLEGLDESLIPFCVDCHI